MKINSFNYKKLNLILLITLIIFSFISYAIGIADITFKDAMNVLLTEIPFFRDKIDISNVKNGHLIILKNLRFPRVLLSIIIGAGLSVVGGVFQGLFKNPLAEPYILGISSGASLFATIAIIFESEYVFLIFSGASLFAIIGALVSVLLVIIISSRFNSDSSINSIPSIMLLLSGISVGLFFDSIATVMISVNTEKIKSITLWGMGSFQTATWEKVFITFPSILLCIIIINFFARHINVISIGDNDAQNLGIDVKKSKIILVILSSIVVALSVASSGVIGFVGLIIPNLLRGIIGADYRKLLKTSALCGGLFLLFCDTIGRMILPFSEIPVGSITAFIGAPFFLYIIIKGNK